jgi:hypothetical protein
VVEPGTALKDVSIELEAEGKAVVKNVGEAGALDGATGTSGLEIGTPTTSDEGLILELGPCSIGVMIVVLG